MPDASEMQARAWREKAVELLAAACRDGAADRERTLSYYLPARLISLSQHSRGISPARARRR
jgi:hypothetical protein